MVQSDSRTARVSSKKSGRSPASMSSPAIRRRAEQLCASRPEATLQVGDELQHLRAEHVAAVGRAPVM